MKIRSLIAFAVIGFLTACSSGNRVSPAPTPAPSPKAVVAPAVNHCLNDPRACEDQWLCVRGTTQTGGKFVWDDRPNFKKFADEARRRGLYCLVDADTKPSSSNETCEVNPGKCDESKLCLKATSVRNNIREWDNYGIYKKYVAEAKRRGLSCGVSTVNQNSTQAAPIAQRNNIAKILTSGLKRIRNLGYVNQPQVDSITDKLKKMSSAEYEKLKRLCEVAYADLAPQQCDQRLKDLAD